MINWIFRSLRNLATLNFAGRNLAKAFTGISKLLQQRWPVAGIVDLYFEKNGFKTFSNSTQRSDSAFTSFKEMDAIVTQLDTKILL
jgi:hypothetical protein